MIKMSKRETLLQEFEDYINTFKEIDITPEEEESECSLKMVSSDKSYWYQKELITFNDVNCAIDPQGDFGIRTDDDFWCIAHLPKKYRYLHIKDIAPILWPNNTFTLTPLSPSKARREWLGSEKAQCIMERYKNCGDLKRYLEIYTGGYNDPPYTKTSLRGQLLNIVTAGVIKRHLLKIIPKDDPLYPLVKSIKHMAMKKRNRRYHEIIMKRYCNTNGKWGKSGL